MSAQTMKNIVVIGGSGNIGEQIINTLLNASFCVTAITRLASTAQFPHSVKVHRLDILSKPALVAALQGQDAVVSLVSHYAIDSQPLINDAAVEAGVSRFVPSGFGIDSRVHLGFSWTALGVGLPFDYNLEGLRRLIGVDVKTRTMNIIDSGDEPFQATSMRLAAAAAVSILRHPTETTNQYLSIASFNTTQNEILRTLEAQTNGAKWKVHRINSADLEREGDARRDAGELNVLEYLKLYAFADGAGHWLEESLSANALLELEKEDVETVLKAVLQKGKVSGHQPPTCSGNLPSSPRPTEALGG